MPHDNKGNYLTVKEYLARWKDGIQKVTPLQQIRVQFNSTWISITGIIGGIIICLFNVKGLWWLLLILCGALGNITVMQLGQYQKKILLEGLEKEFEKEVKK